MDIPALQSLIKSSAFLTAAQRQQWLKNLETMDDLQMRELSSILTEAEALQTQPHDEPDVSILQNAEKIVSDIESRTNIPSPSHG